jgi:hypothetical protein
MSHFGGGSKNCGIGGSNTPTRDRSSYKQGVNIEAARKYRLEQHKKISKERKEMALKKKRVLLEDDLEDWEIEGAILFYMDPSSDRVKATRGIRGVLMADEEKAGEIIMKMNILGQLVDSLSGGRPNDLVVEALWAITHLSATTYARDVANSGAIEAIFYHWNNTSDPEIKETCVLALTNIASERDLRQMVLSKGIFERLYVRQSVWFRLLLSWYLVSLFCCTVSLLSTGLTVSGTPSNNP